MNTFLTLKRMNSSDMARDILIENERNAPLLNRINYRGWYEQFAIIYGPDINFDQLKRLRKSTHINPKGKIFIQ